MAENKKYISSINGFFIKDIEAQNAADVAQQTANQAISDAAAAQGTADNAAQVAANALSLAQSRNKAKVYNNFTALVTDLAHYEDGDENDDTYEKKFAVGTNLLIKALGVPDYWVTELYDPERMDDQFYHSLTSGEDPWIEIKLNGSDGRELTCYAKGKQDVSGHYEQYIIGAAAISMLESEKIDISDFIEKEEYNQYKADIVNGTIVVGKATMATNANSAESATYATSAGSATYATSAGSATNATNDAAGNNIISHYATKDELKAEKITATVESDGNMVIKKNDQLLFTV